KPRLADPGLAGHEEERAAPALGLVERGAELAELPLAADEDTPAEPVRREARLLGRGFQRASVSRELPHADFFSGGERLRDEKQGSFPVAGGTTCQQRP